MTKKILTATSKVLILRSRGAAPRRMATSTAMVRDARKRALLTMRPRSFVQPHVLEAQIVVLAVVVRREALHIRLPAIDRRAVQDHRPRGVVDQDAFDVPDD